MKKEIMTMQILGTDYKIYTANQNDVDILKKCDGYILPEKKIIYLDESNQPVHQKHVLTHELIHAFLYESGLDIETWANNEEIVDWIAIQINKIALAVNKGVKNLNDRNSK